MSSGYHDYFRHFSTDLYRPHQYHEDLISRHRQILNKSIISADERIEMERSQTDPMHLSPSGYTLPCTSLSPVTLDTTSASFGCKMETVDLQESSEHTELHAQLCPHHSVHFANHFEDSPNEYHQYKSQCKSSPPLFNKMIFTVAKHFLNDERDRKYYADMYSCMPPPFFILTITLVEVI